MAANHLAVDSDVAMVASRAGAWADNAEALAGTFRLVVKHRPETFLAVVSPFDSFGRALRRLHEAIEAELEKGAEWQDFLDEHQELAT